jgi:predicted nucleotidyltransferase
MMKFSPPGAEILNRAVDLVVSACRTAFMDSLVCVILKGSSVRGDFIQGYSDLDFNVFLKPGVMDGEKSPKVDGAIRFQRALGDIDPEDFGASQFQIYFIDSEKYPHDWVSPLEGTYRIFWGNLPSVARQMEDSVYLSYAKQFLSDVEYTRKKIVERFIDKPNYRLPPIVRLLGASLKGYMYSVSVLLTSKPKIVLRLKVDKLLPIVEEGIGSKGHFSKFFSYVVNWSLIKKNYENAREAFREGTKALDEISCWSRKLT